VIREIFAATSLCDDQEPLEDSVAELLEVIPLTLPLPIPAIGDDGEPREDLPPYPRRPSHGGPDGEWRIKETRTGEWTVVGTRPGRALGEMGQDAYDQALAEANGVATWVAGSVEVDARSPETIVYTRHWRVPDKPPDFLIDLRQELGFRIVAGTREAMQINWLMGRVSTVFKPEPKVEAE